MPSRRPSPRHSSQKRVALVGVERAAEALVRADDRLGQRRVDPRVGLGLERVVAPAVGRGALDALVHRAHRAAGLDRGLGPAVDEHVHVVERAPQPAPRVLLEVRVLAHAGGDRRVGDLQQQRRAGAEHRPRVARAPPRDALRSDREPHRLLVLREHACHESGS